jgi:hypothetical protein
MKECPLDDDCACAISTRHEWLVAFSDERTKHTALLAALASLVTEWRERARRVRPLESARITNAKREAIAEWMHYTNRANELAALLPDPPRPQKSNEEQDVMIE